MFSVAIERDQSGMALDNKVRVIDPGDLYDLYNRVSFLKIAYHNDSP